MTRDEALKRYHEECGKRGLAPDQWATARTIALLEALGLISFDENETDEGERAIRSFAKKAWSRTPPDRLGDALAEDLRLAGFKIVRRQAPSDAMIKNVAVAIQKACPLQPHDQVAEHMARAAIEAMS